LLRAFDAAGHQFRLNAGGDVNMYHLGNNEQHAAIYRSALERPGVVVLHDALLQHLFLRTLSEREYLDEFIYNYGPWHADIACDLYRRPSGLRPELYRFPMLKRIAEASPAIVVHNRAAAGIVLQHAPSASVTVIPHLFETPPSPAFLDVLDFRERHRIPPFAIVFGVFGYLRESKRVTTVLRAFRHVHHAVPNTILLVAGEFVSPDLPLAIGPLLDQSGVIRLGHLPERDFWIAASVVDACLNLRYPACGETSGIAIRMMGLGKCVILSDVPENAEFPDGCCLRIDTGIREEAMTAEMMMTVARFPEMAAEIGKQAGQHIADRHPTEVIAKLYWELLESVYARRPGSPASAR
jgi:glycosyltransferase involved in cell wall biosynthesis